MGRNGGQEHEQGDHCRFPDPPDSVHRPDRGIGGAYFELWGPGRSRSAPRVRTAIPYAPAAPPAVKRFAKGYVRSTSSYLQNAPPARAGIDPRSTRGSGLLLRNESPMDVIEAIRAYRPCHQYASRPLPAEKLKAVLAAARLSPSQHNMQPWRFVVVQDDERRRMLAQACVKGKPVAEAPISVVVFSVEEDLPVTIGGYISAYPLDVAVAINNLQLAATAEGLGSMWIVDFHEEKVRAVLGVPEGIHPLGIIPLGFPGEGNGSGKAPGEGRKSPDEIVAYDNYPW